MEFEWRIYPGHTTLQILPEIQKLMRELKWEPEQLPGRMKFISMLNDIIWRDTVNELNNLKNSEMVSEHSHDRLFPSP